MSKVLSIFLLIFSLVLIILTTIFLRKGKIPIKYSLVWYFSACSLLLVSILPRFFEKISSMVGFETPSNFILAIIITLLLFITMSLTIIVSSQKAAITILIQEISMLKSKKDDEND